MDNRALPYRPIKLPGGQRMERTWNPGNPVATVQVFGAEEKQTTLNGMWKDRFLNDNGSSSSAIIQFDGQRLTNCVDAESAIQQLRRQGLMLRFQWDNHVRLGFMTEFVPTWHRRQDLEWEMTFEWVAFNDVPVSAPLAPATGISDFQSTLAALNSQVDQFIALGNGYAQQYINAVKGLQGTIEASALQVADIVNQGANLTLSPVRQAQRTTAAINDVDNKYEAMASYIDSQPDIVRSRDGAMTSYGLTLALEQTSRNLGSSAKQGRRASANQRILIAQQADPEVLGAFKARQNMDLRQVSTQFYGTPNDWIQIKVYNGLSSSKLTAGQTILVPRLQIQVGV